MKRLSFFLALILVLSLLSTAVFSAQGLSVSPLQDATESTLSSDPSETEEPAEPSEPTEPEDPTEPTEPEDPTPEPLYPKTEQHPIYVSGSSDGFFRPRASLTRSEFAQIIYRLTDLPDSEDCPFSDIPDNKWYTAAVRALAASGYMNGFPDGTFRPRNPVTRAQLVVVLSKIRPEAPETNSTFSDVPESHWSYVAVSLAQSKGWVSGYSDGTFRPNKPVTRAEAVTSLNQFLGRTPDRDVIDQVSDLLYFPDVQRSNWFYYQVMEAAVPHDASFASPEAPEAWLEYTPEGPHLQDGFHCVNNKLYVVENGVFVRTEGDGAVGEVSYHCQGETGICTVSVPIVQDFNGSLVMIGSSGNPIGTPGQYQNGFYLLENTLYAVMKGYVVNSEVSASLNGVSFRCSGPEGVCTAQTEVLQLYNGELIFLRSGTPIAAPGQYRNGFHVKAGHLYVVLNGKIRNTAGTGNYDGVSYSCEGADGRCTTANWNLLYLPDVDISCFQNALPSDVDCSFTDVPASAACYHAVAVQTALGILEGTDSTHFQPNAAVSYGQALKAAVKVYEFYFDVEPMPHAETDQYYAGKALEYGILDKALSNYSAAATRGDAAAYLSKAMHGRELDEINDVNGIPDVPTYSSYYSAMMTLYLTGITKGLDASYNAKPAESLTRGELAQLLTRLVLPAERLEFNLHMKINETYRYGTSGSGKYALNAYRIGNGKNVMVLTFAIHGWEDNWAKDGQELVYLADQTRQYLLNHYDLVENGNWSVYILRCLNPDGLYDGTTCNGPGRCTTTYYNANGVLVSGSGKGIDMNRCFPYKYSSRTDARNFNGTAPLQCVEARALAQYIQTIKGSGHNILIDTHGWLSQIIPSSGKGTIYNALLKQFPYSTYANLANGSGYFSSWAAFNVGYDSCLLELPSWITSHDKFISSNCVGKFEAVVADLLKNYKTKGITRGPLPEDEFELDGN